MASPVPCWSICNDFVPAVARTFSPSNRGLNSMVAFSIVRLVVARIVTWVPSTAVMAPLLLV